MENNSVELKDIKTQLQDQVIKNMENGKTELSDIQYGYDNKALDVEGSRNKEKTNEEDKQKTGVESDEEDDDDLEYKDNFCSHHIMKVQSSIKTFYHTYNKQIWIVILLVLAGLYFAYFTYSLTHEIGDEGSWRLVVCTIIAGLLITWNILYKYFGAQMTFSYYWNRVPESRRTRLEFWIQMIACVILTVGVIVYIIVEIAIKKPENLISLCGLVFFILFFYIFSHNPARVNWRPVFWGMILQFYFALIILRWSDGYDAFQWLGDRVTEFLAYTDEGVIFVFGKDYFHHYFAFKVLSVIIFFSSVVSMLYYLGVMQFIIRNIAVFIATVMGTSPAESLNTASNIFLGQTESPLMIRPFLPLMTKSEVHAICTGGFATVAGSTLAGYISYGVKANHLLSASLMSAPAALAMAKLFYPETKKSKVGNEVYNIKKGSERNILEAASKGASNALIIVGKIAANLIALTSLVEFFNQTLIWFGKRAGLDESQELSFQFLCSYVFSPISFLMGVQFSECRKVAELIGYKTFINEFFAYEKLSVYIHNKENLTWYESLPYQNLTGNFTGNWTYVGDDIVYQDFKHTLVKGLLSDRSMVIATYALCGFSNISSIGIMIGAISALAPNQSSAVSQVVVRAMIAGNVACFMTACVAGLLYEETQGY